MAYYTDEQLRQMNFKRLGRNVKISDKASLYDTAEMEIGDFSRIDDYCIVSGRIIIGAYCHVTPMCLLAGGAPGITLSDYSTLAYGVKIFAQSDDYSGATMVNSLIPKKFKNEYMAPVFLGRHVIVGTNAVVFPGVTIEEGCSIGAMTLVNKTTDAWGIYVGSPARRIRERKQDLLALEAQFRDEVRNDPL
ncbi:acyltransferase [Marinobacter sp. R17]|uniref:acyltransferase n=1 Tax=Marinobacter sp. R17 TaxID=2484250 RepID=UPI000F4CDECC|nr:acyltransferase [Marinobacter sp. R17]ROU00579.1 acyltransferase [Marinobacter sp. R17]